MAPRGCFAAENFPFLHGGDCISVQIVVQWRQREKIGIYCIAGRSNAICTAYQK